MSTSIINAITGQIFVPSGQQIVNLPAYIVQTPVGVVNSITLVSGANTITIPSGTTYIIIQPPTNNMQTLTLKGVTGDTGLPMSKVLYHIYTPDSSATSFVITAGGNTAAPTTITFY